MAVKHDAPREKCQDANGIAAIARKLRDSRPTTAKKPETLDTQHSERNVVAQQPRSRLQKRAHEDILQPNLTSHAVDDVDSNPTDTNSSSNGSGASSVSRSSSSELEGCKNTDEEITTDDATAPFTKLYTNIFTDVFADELQAFREADTGKHTVPIDLVSDAINMTFENIPPSQRTAWLQDVHVDSAKGATDMRLRKFEANWL